MKDLKKALMENIRARRIAMGLSREALGKKIGFCGDAAVRFWETGQRLPGAVALYRLARVFGCTVDDLMGGTHENAG